MRRNSVAGVQARRSGRRRSSWIIQQQEVWVVVDRGRYVATIAINASENAAAAAAAVRLVRSKIVFVSCSVVERKYDENCRVHRCRPARRRNEGKRLFYYCKKVFQAKSNPQYWAVWCERSDDI